MFDNVRQSAILLSMKTERIAVRVTKKTKEKLEKVANINKRKPSDQARFFIEKGLESKRSKE